jgi:hypothetical protein
MCCQQDGRHAGICSNRRVLHYQMILLLQTQHRMTRPNRSIPTLWSLLLYRQTGGIQPTGKIPGSGESVIASSVELGDPAVNSANAAQS